MRGFAVVRIGQARTMSRVYEALKRVELEREHAPVEEIVAPRAGADAADGAAADAWWRGAGCGFAAGLVVACAVLWGAVSIGRVARLESVTTQTARPMPDAGSVHAASRTLAPDAPDEIPAAVPPASTAADPVASADVPPDPQPPSAPERPARAQPSIMLQAGSFRDEGNAVRLAAALRASGYPVEIVRRDGDPATWNVHVGAWRDRRAAAAARAALERDGHATFVVVRGAR